MKKKLLGTLLGASLLLAACGGEKAADKPVAEAETIKIGAMGPLTGPVAIYGISATNGLKLVIDEINANGGILGKQVELNLLDEKGDSTEAVNAYNKLVDWGMVALFVYFILANICFVFVRKKGEIHGNFNRLAIFCMDELLR